MKKLISLAVITAFVLVSSGCANGPLNRFRRGAPCSFCNPRISVPTWAGFRSNTATNCESGACGSGVAAPPFNQGVMPDGYSYPINEFAPGYPGDGMIGVPNTQGQYGPAPGFQPDGLPMYGQPDLPSPNVGDPFSQIDPGNYGLNNGNMVLPPTGIN